jgi:hypothetical protein
MLLDVVTCADHPVSSDSSHPCNILIPFSLISPPTLIRPLILPSVLSPIPPKSQERTFTRNIRRNNPPTAQPDPRNLPLARVGLLGLRSPDPQANALHLWPVDERGRCRLSRCLLGPAAAQDLIVGCIESGCGGECAAGEDSGGGGGDWRRGGGKEGAGR